METALLILWIVIGLAFVAAGIIFCILPVLPGPPLSYVGLIILAWARDWGPYSTQFLLIMAGLMIFVTTVDGIIPLFGARRYGASKEGLWGSAIGMLVGMFFVPPWGIFIGAFAGALIGEYISGKRGGSAMRVGWGIFVGVLAGIGLKLAYSLATLVFFVRGILV
jgi:hypothetical protein